MGENNRQRFSFVQIHCSVLAAPYRFFLGWPSIEGATQRTW